MVRFGVSMFPTDYAVQPIELARAVEERGLDSLFFPEHTHIPTSRRSPWPAGGELPREYWHTHDPFVALGAAAAVTSRIRLGTGICLIVERDPIQLAKEVASLDMISQGRLILGIGGGWNAEEMENHGVPFAKRWKVVREKVLALRAIWTQEEAQFHGEFVNFDPIWSYPKPVQPGGPPIWLGAASKWAFDRVAEYCDGWMPILGPGKDGLARLREACERRGRRFEDIQLALFAAPPDEEPLRKLAAQGFQDLVFHVPAAGADQVYPLLDRYAALAEKLRR
jgi:probable F420-dependent oxidoreductase